MRESGLATSAVAARTVLRGGERRRMVTALFSERRTTTQISPSSSRRGSGLVDFACFAPGSRGPPESSTAKVERMLPRYQCQPTGFDDQTAIKVTDGSSSRLRGTLETLYSLMGVGRSYGSRGGIARCTCRRNSLRLSLPHYKAEINRAETFVVVEGAAQFQDQQNQTSSVASCDVFQFSDGRLVEVTSYVIELNKSWLHSGLSLG